MRYDESFGVIPLKKDNGQWVVFLIRHKNGGHWSLPKGHAESGETPLQAASRELFEETGLECLRLIQEAPLKEHYIFHHQGVCVSKQVFYFLAEVSGNVTLQQEEVDEGGWMSFQEAVARVTFPEARAVLENAEVLLKLV